MKTKPDGRRKDPRNPRFKGMSFEELNILLKEMTKDGPPDEPTDKEFFKELLQEINIRTSFRLTY